MQELQRVRTGARRCRDGRQEPGDRHRGRRHRGRRRRHRPLRLRLLRPEVQRLLASDRRRRRVRPAGRAARRQAERFAVADPADADAATGPVVNEGAVEQFERAVEDAGRDGA